MYLHFLLTTATLVIADFSPWHASICQAKPALAIVAGSVVSSQLNCPPNEYAHCQAVLQFRNQTFLPFIADLTAQSGCSYGDSCTAEFIVPYTSPNGPATLFWLCAGESAPTCIEVEITRGQGEPKELIATSRGTLICMASSDTSPDTTPSSTTLVPASSLVTETFTPPAATTTTTITTPTILTFTAYNRAKRSLR